MNSFEQCFNFHGLLEIGDGAGPDDRITIPFWVARAHHNDGDSAGVEEHLKAFQHDKAVAGRKTKIEKNKVGLLLAGGAYGGHTVPSGDNVESSRLKPAGEGRKLEVFILDDHNFLLRHCKTRPYPSDEMHT